MIIGGGKAAPAPSWRVEMEDVRILAGMAGIVAVTLFLLLVQLASFIPSNAVIAS